MGDTNRPSEFELIENRSRTPASKAPDCSRGRQWLPLAMVFLATSLALAAYIIHLKISESYEEDLMLRYPGFFRTEEEQRQFAEEYMNKTRNRNTGDLVNVTSLTNCSFRCNAYPANRIKRRSSLINRTLKHLVTLYSPAHALKKRETDIPTLDHACCVSKTKWDSPEYAYNFHDQWVKLAVIKNRKQYFPNETCSQARGCTGCTCAQDMTYTSAVVSSGVLQLIQVPGCCHCLN